MCERRDKVVPLEPAPLIDRSHADRFVEYFGIMQAAVHKVNVDNGWWESKDADFLESVASRDEEIGIAEPLRVIAQKLRSRNDGEMIALMHSELSEALEGHRHHNPPSDHIPEFSATEEEMADTVIRIMDYSQSRGLRVAQAIIVKLKFNAGRGHKHGGKVC